MEIAIMVTLLLWMLQRNISISVPPLLMDFFSPHSYRFCLLCRYYGLTGASNLHLKTGHGHLIKQKNIYSHLILRLKRLAVSHCLLTSSSAVDLWPLQPISGHAPFPWYDRLGSEWPMSSDVKGMARDCWSQGVNSRPGDTTSSFSTGTVVSAKVSI